MTYLYHPGERAVQRRAGGVEDADWGAEHAIHSELPEVAAGFLTDQRVLLVGHQAAEGAVWASALAGPPGFLEVDGPRRLRVAARAVPGDALAAALEAGGAQVGLLAMKPDRRQRMRVNGPARPTASGFVVDTEQVYANCPKYINARTPEDRPDAHRPGEAIRSASLSDPQRRRLAAADAIFVATAHTRSGADVSHRGGRPGFLTVHSGRRLSWPDYRGNSMYMTLGNLELDARAGLLVVDDHTGGLLQLTGRARVDWDPERAAAVPGAQRMIDFDVEAVVELPGALGLRWRPGRLSKLSPPLAS